VNVLVGGLVGVSVGGTIGVFVGVAVMVFVGVAVAVFVGVFVGPPQVLAGEALLRGAGVPEVKSAPLLSVSWQPPSFRDPDVVLLNVGATLPPSEQVVPVP
jgi:hypothetical protein